MEAHSPHDGHEHHVTSLQTYLLVFAALAVLVVLTVGAAFLPVGHTLSALLAFVIASTKAFLVIAFFMHAKESGKLVWAFAASGFFSLFILLLIMMGDYWAGNTVRFLDGSASLWLNFI
jgi:cytochrome c oxidase subunit 4